MRMKIVSDGTADGTQVVDAATGERLEGTYGVTWSISVDDCVADATISVRKVAVEVEAEVSDEVETVDVTPLGVEYAEYRAVPKPKGASDGTD